MMDSDSEDYKSGFIAAHILLIEIWDQMKKFSNTPEDLVNEFELFLALAEMRMNGGNASDLAMVAELNNRPGMASAILKNVE